MKNIESQVYIFVKYTNRTIRDRERDPLAFQDMFLLQRCALTTRLTVTWSLFCLYIFRKLGESILPQHLLDIFSCGRSKKKSV